MTLLGSLFNNVEDILLRIRKGKRSSVSDYCPVSGWVNETTLLLESGAMLSIFRLTGVSYLIGDQEQKNLLEDLLRVMTAMLRPENTVVQLVYQRDRRRVRTILERKFKPLRGKLRQVDLDLDAIIDEKIDKIVPTLAGTEVYCAVCTFSMNLVSKENMQAHMRKRLEAAGVNFPISDVDSIQTFLSPDVVVHRHQSSVASLETAFQRMRMGVEKLDSHGMVKLFREMLFPKETGEEWKARLPGDAIHPQYHRGRPFIAASDPRNLGAFLYPPIGRQVAAAPVFRDKTMEGVVKIGGQYSAAHTITLLPETPKPIDDLLMHLADVDIPLRLSFTFYGGADFFYGKMQSKTTVSYLASFSWPPNKRISAAGETLNDLVSEKGETLCGISMAVATWGDNFDQASERSRKVGQALDAWGGLHSELEVGDPFLAVTSTIPGWFDNLRTVNINTVRHMLPSLPVQIVASPWSEGTMIFRDKQGGIFPYQPLSSLQQTTNILCFSPPGGGKSNLISAMILAGIMDPVLEGMPKIAVIDIGNSSKGVINLLRSAAISNPDRFVHIEFELSERFGINVFDTRLGCSRPTTVERGFLSNFLGLIFTPEDSKTQLPNSSPVVQALIEESYRRCEEDEPNIFDPTIDAQINEWIKREISAGFPGVTSKTTWWSIVDHAMKRKSYDMAARAQRYAVPTLKTVYTVLNNSKAIAAYNETDPVLIGKMKMMLMGFMDSYPSLARPSVYTFQESDVCVIDLNKVTQDTGAAGARKTSIAYMLSRYLLGKDFLSNRDILDELPERAKAYYRDRITHLEMVRKYLFYDEFHRTSGADAVRRTVVDDKRNGRKFNLMVMLASQNFNDFDEDMIKISTTRFILRVDSPEEARALAEKYGWSESVRQALSRDVRGAGEGGASMLLDVSGLKTQEGVCTQVITSIMGSTELAAYGTTREDAALRDTLIAEGIPYWDVVTLIGRLFPRGVKKYVEDSMRLRRANQTSSGDEEADLRGALAPFIDQVKKAYIQAGVRRIQGN